MCQCSGNRRGLFNPHVPGVQWGSGAMGDAAGAACGCATCCKRAGVKPNAVECGVPRRRRTAAAAPHRLSQEHPDRARARRKRDHRLRNERRAAADLNGFPARLIVPGWTGTYWMKHLTSIEVRDKPLDNFWMRKAYRVPRGMFPVRSPVHHPGRRQDRARSPRSWSTRSSRHRPTAPAVAASGFKLRGLAWDRGHGIKPASRFRLTPVPRGGRRNSARISGASRSARSPPLSPAWRRASRRCVCAPPATERRDPARPAARQSGRLPRQYHAIVSA